MAWSMMRSASMSPGRARPSISCARRAEAQSARRDRHRGVAPIWRTNLTAKISWARWFRTRWAMRSRGESGAGRDYSSSRCSSPPALIQGTDALLRCCARISEPSLSAPPLVPDLLLELHARAFELLAHAPSVFMCQRHLDQCRLPCALGARREFASVPGGCLGYPTHPFDPRGAITRPALWGLRGPLY